MLPLQSLLNPSSTECTPRHLQHGISQHATYFTAPDMTKVASPGRGGPLSRRNKKLEDAHVLAKLKARGPINYPPFEDLDDGSLQAVLKFQVTPFGTIHESFQHIPYSSSKKDLFEKTGRESIEGWGILGASESNF